MFLPLAIAALTAVAAPTVSKTTVKDVKVGIRHGKVSFHIKGNQPISMKKVTAHNGDKAMIIWVRDAVLGQKNKVFKHRDVTIKAHQHKSSVELDIIYKKNLHCEGNVTLKTSTKGIRALTQCDKQPAKLTLAFTKENISKRRQAARVAKKSVLKKAASTPVEKTAEIAASEADTNEVNPLSLAALEAQDVEAEEQKDASSGYAALFIPVFLCMGVAFLGLWIRKKKPTLLKQPGLKITHNTALSPKRSLMIAEIEGHRLLLAASESGIHLIKDMQNELSKQEDEELEELVHEFVQPINNKKPRQLFPESNTTENVEPEKETQDLWAHSGLEQTPSLALVDDTQKAPIFESMLSETAEDELLRRKIQSSRNLYLA
jgi:flagellar biogenesis protein FliO